MPEEISMPSPAPNGAANGADTVARIRTLALVGPAAAGKTSQALGDLTGIGNAAFGAVLALALAGFAFSNA
jgi:hypothetical protein